MANKELRKIDKSILGELELNARISYSKLGRNIRKSQQRVSYTVNSLMERDIIQKFLTLTDFFKIGILDFRVYFKVNFLGQKEFDLLIDYLVSDKYTSWVATCGGRHDIICTFFTKSPSQLNANLRTIMAKFPNLLQDYNVLTTISIRDYGRKYLVKKTDSIPEIKIGGRDTTLVLDDIDKKILNELSEDARKSSVVISNKLNMSSKTVIERIKKLTNKGMIVGYKPMINAREMGYIPGLLLIKYHNVTPEMVRRLKVYLKGHPNVVEIAKTLGRWDVEVFIEASGSMELRSIEMGIRQKFVSIIQKIESVPIYRCHKKNYFPNFLPD